MKVLIVSATEGESEALRHRLGTNCCGYDFEYLATGIGMVATACALTERLMQKSYDLAVNVGVAGAIDRTLQIGDVTVVAEEHLVEMGAEDGDRFLTFSEIGLPAADRIVPSRLKQASPDLQLRSVKSVTVNTVHGNDSSIDRLRLQSDAAIESMEGAAFFYCCDRLGIPCLQFRAISNYVERRNRDAWDLPLALDRLTETVVHYFKSTSGHA